jgi:hypothetical protein
MDENPYRPPQTDQSADPLLPLLRSLRIWTVLAWLGAGVVTTLVFGGIGVLGFRLWHMIEDLRAL